MTQFLSIFSNIGQVLEFGQVLTDQLKNVYSVNLTKDARFGVDTVENRTKEGGMEILQQRKASLQLVMGFEKMSSSGRNFGGQLLRTGKTFIPPFCPKAVLTLKLVKLRLKGPSCHRYFQGPKRTLMLS